MLDEKNFCLCFCDYLCTDLVACGKKVAPITLPQTMRLQSIDITLRKYSKSFRQN